MKILRILRILLGLFLFSFNLFSQFALPSIGSSTGSSGGGGGNTFNLVGSPVDSGFQACNTTCSVTIPGTASGHVGIVLFTNASGAAGVISSISGAGTWVVPGGSVCALINGTDGGMSCAYNLNESAGATSLTVTSSAGVASTNTNINYREYSVTPGPAIFDVAGALRTMSGTIACPTLTLTGTSDVVVQGVTLSGGTISSISGSYTSLDNVLFGANANKLNTTSPTCGWTTDTGTRDGVAIGIALK